MAKRLSPVLGPFVDDEGAPAAGFKLWVYGAGGTTPTTSYKDSAGAASHANPIILDSAGMPPSWQIWLDAGVGHRLKLYDPDNVPTEFDIDNIYGVGSEAGPAQTDLNTGGNDIVSPVGQDLNLVPGAGGVVKLNGVSITGTPAANYVILASSDTEAAWTLATTFELSSDLTPVLGGNLTAGGKSISFSSVGGITTDSGYRVLSFAQGTGGSNLENIKITNNSLSMLIEAKGTLGTENIDIRVVPQASGYLYLDQHRWPNTDSTAGYLASTNGSNQIVFVPPPASSNYVYIASGSESAVANVDIPLDTDTYESFTLEFYDVTPATDATSLYLRFSNNGGSSFRTGASDYGYSFAGNVAANTFTSANSVGAAQIILTNATLSNAAGEIAWGELRIKGAGLSGSKTTVLGEIATHGAAGGLVTTTNSGIVQTAEVNNYLRLYANSGNITLKWTLSGKLNT